MFKKLSVIMMALVFLLSGFSGVLTTKASAATNEVVNTEVVYQEVQQSPASMAVKEAAKWALKNTTTITNLVGKALGKDAAITFGNVVNTSVKPKLNKLIKAHDATYAALEDVFVSALKPVVSSPATAKKYARHIMTIIQVFSPI